MAQINGLKICWGVKRGKRVICGEPVTDEKTIEEVLRLIEELKRRCFNWLKYQYLVSVIYVICDPISRWVELYV